MPIRSRISLALAALVMSVPALAQNKAVHDEIQRLEQQVNKVAATDPLLATKLKLRAEELRRSIAGPPRLSAAANSAGSSGSYSVVAPNYSISGDCGAFDSGAAGNTVGAASTNTPLAIPDLTTISDTVVIAGLGSQLFDLDLTLAITHTFCADLDITLTSPLGTIAAVSLGNGGGNQDVFNGTLFDDQSANSVVTYSYVNGVAAPDLRPEQSFNGTFRGENPNGTWTLTISDTAGADVGTLNSWSLSVTDGAIVHVPPSLAVTSFSTGPISVAIPDLGVGTAPLVVSGGPTNITSDVQVYVEIQHTYCSDMVIQVQSPLGTLVDLSINWGDWYADVFNGTLFDMDSLNPIATYSFTNFVAAPDLVPDGDLALFNGENANGTWNLIVTDTAAIDIGTINRWDLRLVECAGGVTYCTAKVNSIGCLPAISSTGVPSATSGAGFVVTGINVRNNKPGLLIYTASGRAATVFAGGYLCINSPVKRSIPLASGGTAPPASDCSGVYSIDVNTFAVGGLGGNPAGYLQVMGTLVDGQIWGRDPGFAFPNNATLTEGIEWTVGP